MQRGGRVARFVHSECAFVVNQGVRIIPRPIPHYLIVTFEELVCVGADAKLREIDRDALITDRAECPLADPVLMALRQAFSATFLGAGDPNATQEALDSIRAVCIMALIPLSKPLRVLGLKPVATGANEESKDGPVFKHIFCRRETVLKLLDDEETRPSLLEMLGGVPADDLIVCLHTVHSLTNEEAVEPDDQLGVLEAIRQAIAATLAPFNYQLECIDIEPIAVPMDAFFRRTGT